MRAVRPSRVFVAVSCATLAACERPVAPSTGSERASNQRPEVLLHAATSTRDAVLALEAACESVAGVDLVVNFGASGVLAKQIVAGGQADLFLSADEAEMDKLAAAGWLEAGTRRALLSNQLVVIEPADEPTRFAAPFDPRQLAQPGIRLLALGDPASVPVGRYARRWLASQGAWESVADRILPATDARAALAAVESGGAQAGIVYRTDALRSGKVRSVHRVPIEAAPRIVYPLAVMRGRASPAALDCALFLASEEALAVFEAQGFARPPQPAASPR